EFGGHLSGEGTRHLLASDLYTRDLAVMAHPKLPESELTKSIFSTLNSNQSFSRHRPAVLDARGETRGCRFVPNAQSCLAGESPNFFLGEAGIKERRCNSVLRGCDLAGTEFALVVEVHPICDGFKSMGGAKVRHHGK